jgi:hypothetical protein
LVLFSPPPPSRLAETEGQITGHFHLGGIVC